MILDADILIPEWVNNERIARANIKQQLIKARNRRIRAYLTDGCSKAEIARRLGVSRTRALKLIEYAQYRYQREKRYDYSTE